MSASTRASLRKVCRFDVEGDGDESPANDNDRTWRNKKNTNHHGDRTFGVAKRITKAQKHNRPSKYESTILEDLNDPKSELARFLFVKDVTGSRNGSWLYGSWLNGSWLKKSVRHLASSLLHSEGDGEDDEMHVQSLNHQHAWYYSLALEPLEVRSERIIMMAEAYALFGALFLTGTFVLYEWGSPAGYGGSGHPLTERIFEIVMAMGITANIFLAMFASFLWLTSILYSQSHRSWVYASRKMLLYCHQVLTCVIIITVAGIAIGILNKLSPYWPDTIICLAFFLIVVGVGLWRMTELLSTQVPLEYYHLAFWFKCLILPFALMTKKKREKVKESAKVRAKELKQKTPDQK